MPNDAAMGNPVIRNCSHCLVHVPDLVRYGSKPRRETLKDPSTDGRLAERLRSFEDAVRYPPNQTAIGNLTPERLAEIPRLWFESGACDDAPATGPFGTIVGQDLFYALLQTANVLTPPLVSLVESARADIEAAVAAHEVLADLARPSFVSDEGMPSETTLTLRTGDAVRGWMRRDDRAEGREDENLDAHTLLEALSAKASGALALQDLLHREGTAATEIDYVISCGEEAAGDRYQRGGGGMAKAIAEMCGCTNASGMDDYAR